MGHVSDAVHKYQQTSDKQKMEVSGIIQGEIGEIKLSQAEPMHVVEVPKEASIEEKFKLPKLVLPIGTKSEVEKKQNSENVCEMIQTAVSAVGSRKAKLTIHVELLD